LLVKNYISEGKRLGLFKLGLLFCLLLLFKNQVFAQDNKAWTIEVRGTVEENDKRLEGAIVTLLANGSPVNSVTTPNGSFAFTLQNDIDYTITFTKPGYITKRLKFSTQNVPADRSKFGFSAYNDVEVNIFPEIPGTDIDQILLQPIGKIGYEAKFHNGDFTYDEKYTQSIQSVLDKILAAQKAAAEKAKQLEEQYKKIIAKADNEFGAKDWTNAKADYNAALGLKPNEAYPKAQLAAIDKAIADKAAADADAAKKLAGQKALQAKYDSLVKIGDANFKTQSYPAAKMAFNSALQVKPDQQYPKDEIALIDKAMADAAKNASLKARYDSLVNVGDRAFGGKHWVNAKEAYNGALQIKPNEQYPKDQLAAIDKAIADAASSAQKAALQAKYDSLVKIGDKAFRSKSYSDAKAAYNGALQVKSAEQYPKDQLAAIDKAIAADADASKKAALQAKYDSLVRIGDGAFKFKDYPNAKIAYKGALQVKPDEQYPKDQLAAIDKAIAADADAAKNAAMAKAMQAKYDSLIRIGDDNFKSKTYDKAKTAYSGALQVKSTEQYPKDQIAIINKALADKATAEADAVKKAAMEKAMQAKYDSLIRIGDGTFKSKDYTNAKSAYNAALQVKPNEQYPKDQLALIDKALGAEADAAKKAAMAKAMQAKYDSLVKIGDGAFQAKSYDKAKSAYNGALEVKPNEQYPKDQLALIDKALGAEADAAKKAAMAKALQAKYDSLVKIGDKAFKSKSYSDAKNAYNGALQVKPNEQYPKDQLAAIDNALAADADASKKAAMAKAAQAKYDSLVKIGDKAFNSKTYDAAKNAYNGALQVKPNEQYPKDQLAAIDKAIADAAASADAAKKAALAKAAQAKYDSLVKIGDNAFKAKTYDKAKTAYNGALRVKPDEQYPKDQIKAIDDLLAQQKGNDATYNQLMANGNQNYYMKNYQQALDAFTKASNLKPDEALPKQRIAQIKQLMQALQDQTGNPVKKHDSVTVEPQTADSVAMKYPPGITEETVDEPNCQITRRIVVKGKRGWIFTRKTWNFGTYYFKAGPPDYTDIGITEDNWNKETSGNMPK
jgi:hypothetical protein